MSASVPQKGCWGKGEKNAVHLLWSMIPSRTRPSGLDSLHPALRFDCQTTGGVVFASHECKCAAKGVLGERRKKRCSPFVEYDSFKNPPVRSGFFASRPEVRLSNDGGGSLCFP